MLLYNLQVENHDVDTELMEEVKALTKAHYELNMMPGFLTSDTAKSLASNEYVPDRDWESTFFVWHRPGNTINDITALSDHLR